MRLGVKYVGFGILVKICELKLRVIKFITNSWIIDTLNDCSNELANEDILSRNNRVANDFFAIYFVYDYLPKSPAGIHRNVFFCLSIRLAGQIWEEKRKMSTL